MKKFRAYAFEFVKTVLGCAIFAFGFSMFLEPGGFSAGGISGLSMVIVHLTKFGSVGLISALINLPLFAIAGIKIGKKFFIKLFFLIYANKSIFYIFSLDLSFLSFIIFSAKIAAIV